MIKISKKNGLLQLKEQYYDKINATEDDMYNDLKRIIYLINDDKRDADIIISRLDGTSVKIISIVYEMGITTVYKLWNKCIKEIDLYLRGLLTPNIKQTDLSKLLLKHISNARLYNAIDRNLEKGIKYSTYEDLKEFYISEAYFRLNCENCYKRARLGPMCFKELTEVIKKIENVSKLLTIE